VAQVQTPVLQKKKKCHQDTQSLNLNLSWLFVLNLPQTIWMGTTGCQGDQPVLVAWDCPGFSTQRTNEATLLAKSTLTFGIFLI
jgi:hypothetical protein